MRPPAKQTPDDAMARLDAAIIHAAVSMRETADDPEVGEAMLRAALREGATLVERQQSQWMMLYDRWRRTQRHVRALTVFTAVFVALQIALFVNGQV